VVNPPRDQHGQHPAAPLDRPLDDLAVVRGPRKDGDAPLERIELAYTLRPADADHLVAPVERVLHPASPITAVTIIGEPVGSTSVAHTSGGAPDVHEKTTPQSEPLGML